MIRVVKSSVLRVRNFQMEVFLCVRQLYLKKSKRATGDLDFCPFLITAGFFSPYSYLETPTSLGSWL